MNFPESLIDFVKLLYTESELYVKVNGVRGKPFSIKNGVRQGCPLSTLLYIIAIQPLISRVNINKNITKIPNTPAAVAFADDLTLITKDNESMETEMFEELELYKKGAQGDLNWEKTFAVTINQNPPDTTKQLWSLLPTKNVNPEGIKVLLRSRNPNGEKHGSRKEMATNTQ